jgi:predicted transcriptional regulator
MAKIVIADEDRRVIRATRERLGLSRTTLEQTAKVGQTYVKGVESGRRQSTESATLARLLKALQLQAEHTQVPAKTTAGLLRTLKRVEQQGQKPPKR